VTRPSGQTSAGTARIRLRDAILDGRLRPGQRLRAETLAIELGTSRTPVREALVALEGEGLVEVEPRRGAVVRSFHADDLLDLYEVRAVLEPHAAARAAERIRPEAIDRLRANCREAEAIDADGTEAAERLIALNVELHGIVLEASASPRLTAAMRSVAGIRRPARRLARPPPRAGGRARGRLPGAGGGGHADARPQRPRLPGAGHPAGRGALVEVRPT
jgi:DNA-binding GntR family transcriptional regulator